MRGDNAPTTSNLFPDLASTQSPLTNDLSLKRDLFLSYNLLVKYPANTQIQRYLKGEFGRHLV